MDLETFEKALLLQKQELFKEAAIKTAKNLGVKKPSIKFWEIFCPDSENEEVAHIHLPEGKICISNHWLKSLDLDEIEGVAIHETTHLVHENHDSDFQNLEGEGHLNLYLSKEAEKKY